MKIHPAIWISIGILIVAISWSVGEQLWLFSYVGLLFITWGMGKIIVNFVSKKKTERQVHQMPQIHTPRPAAPSVCPGCKGPLHATYTFCPRCGQRIR